MLLKAEAESRGEKRRSISRDRRGLNIYSRDRKGMSMSKEKGGTITRDRRRMNGKRKNRNHYLETENGLLLNYLEK